MKRNLLLSVLLVSIFSGTLSAQLSYTITELGFLPDPSCNGSSRPIAINESGGVVGVSCSADGSIYRGYYWDREKGMIDMGEIVGGQDFYMPFDINDQGLAVGVYRTSGPDHAFQWDLVNGMQPLPDTPGTLVSHAAEGINNQGYITFNNYDSDGGPKGTARLYDHGNWLLLGGGQTRGINESNQVAICDQSSGNYRGYLWEASAGNPGDPDSCREDIGNLGHDFCSPHDINESGAIVGCSETSLGAKHAFRWDSTEGMSDLGVLSGGDYSTAEGINDSGEIVGSSTVTGGECHAAYWNTEIGIVDLNNCLVGGDYWDHWTCLYSAYDINNDGLIIGSGLLDTDGKVHSFLLTPVPEPSSLVLLVLGGIFIRKRKQI